MFLFVLGGAKSRSGEIEEFQFCYLLNKALLQSSKMSQERQTPKCFIFFLFVFFSSSSSSSYLCLHYENTPIQIC